LAIEQLMCAFAKWFGHVDVFDRFSSSLSRIQPLALSGKPFRLGADIQAERPAKMASR
jgi:hypothetical protein